MPGSERAACPICGKSALRASLETEQLRVSRCDECGHRVADHSAAETRADYHEQYDQGAFVTALQATRQRQAGQILRKLRALDESAKRLLDLGCGRGWFLDTAREMAFEVAGADTSRVAIDLLAQRGIKGVLLRDDAWNPPGLPYRPDVVTLLDVIEHLHPDRVLGALAEVRGSFAPELRLLVVKVPVASGALHRIAEAAARIGSAGMLEQLYQVGTSPPHRSYFSSRSLKDAVERAGFQVLTELRDLDFEPARLADRARSLRRLPRPLVQLAAQAVAGVATSLEAQDSIIVFARPRI